MFLWRLTMNGSFSPSSAWRAFLFGSVEADCANFRWKFIAPPKENFFCCLIMRDRCWTADRLGIGSLPPPPPVCTLCDQGRETIDYLLVQCPYALEVWFRAVGSLIAATHDSVRAWWLSLSGRLPSRRRKEIAVVWLERNARIFNGISSYTYRVADLAMEDLKL